MSNPSSKPLEFEPLWQKLSWALLALSGPLILLVLAGHLSLAALEATLILLSGIFAVKYYSSWKRRLVAANRQKPLWLKNTIEGFWTISGLFIVHTFIVEPMVVPTGSLLPTVELNDRVLVEKFAYGITLPLLNKKIVSFAQPKRGDIIAFEFPLDPRTTYLKRVVAVGGDTVAYDFNTKILTVNGQAGKYVSKGHRQRLRPDGTTTKDTLVLQESLLEMTHLVEQYPEVSGPPTTGMEPLKECEYTQSQMKCKVPDGTVFAVGDNRDASYDSRFWGFVDISKIKGKAQYVLFNFSDMSRSLHKL